MKSRFDEILAAEFGFQKFSFSSEVLFSYFSFISASLMVSTSNIPKYLNFFLLIRHFYFFLLLVFFNFSSRAHFSMPNSIPISLLYILKTFIRISKTVSCFVLFCLFFFCKELDVVHIYKLNNHLLRIITF